MTLGGVALAAQPEPKPDAKQAADQLRAYLPTLRQKALLGNERDHVAALEKAHMVCKVLLEGGLANISDVNRVEEELLRARARVLRGQTAYLDSLDQFTERVKVGPERLGRMEETSLSPLTNEFRKFEGLSRSYWAALEVLQKVRPKNAPNVRRALVQALSTTPLMKDTTFRKNIPKAWEGWEKAADPAKNLREALAERNRLLERQNEMEQRRKPFPPADAQRLEDLQQLIALGELESNLRGYESQPWKGLAEKEATGSQERHRRRIKRAFREVLAFAFLEKLNRARRSWPELPPVRVKGVDLLTCDQAEAERTVVAGLKGPEAAVAGKRMVRRVRTLAGVYGLQQRVFDLVYLDWDRRMGDFYFPPGPAPHEAAALGLPVPSNPSPDLFRVEPLPRAMGALARTKREMLETWLDYQMARLDLYHALELPPP